MRRDKPQTPRNKVLSPWRSSPLAPLGAVRAASYAASRGRRTLLRGGAGLPLAAARDRGPREARSAKRESRESSPSRVEWSSREWLIGEDEAHRGRGGDRDALREEVRGSRAALFSGIPMAEPRKSMRKRVDLRGSVRIPRSVLRGRGMGCLGDGRDDVWRMRERGGEPRSLILGDVDHPRIGAARSPARTDPASWCRRSLGSWQSWQSCQAPRASLARHGE